MTWQIEESDGLCRLTLTHDEFETVAETYNGARLGRHPIFASLETDEPLDIPKALRPGHVAAAAGEAPRSAIIASVGIAGGAAVRILCFPFLAVERDHRHFRHRAGVEAARVDVDAVGVRARHIK